jgi:hypothetical protein
MPRGGILLLHPVGCVQLVAAPLDLRQPIRHQREMGGLSSGRTQEEVA